ncbi:hypothetical protein [Roseateles amylovorans]|uniref:Chromosome partition protein Smc n=1 Tax=Roseateles amylovorans TaxID=2978473 RepID=A0ABY6ATP7_9BURK|nr:hypothetical protein [Roseateles amylovorans]UXH76392.1 hypothetical protein N4261_15130 [Roseateles amylovorans]
MNTLRTIVAVAALTACGLTMAQSGATAKPDAKAPAKTARPAEAKPKGKLMTRDELRTCMVENQALEDENLALKAKEKDVLAERDALKAYKAEQDKAEQELQARGTQLKADIEAIKVFGAEIEAGAAKMEKDQLKAKQEEYTTRANALQPRIDAFNKERNERVEKYKGFNERVDAQTKALDDFNERVETMQDKRDEWKKTCANKSYDEADEIAIKKELAAGKK